MRILILSCNTGGGHNAAGRAVKEIFEKNGDEAVMLDYLCLAGNKVSKTVGNVYIETVKNVPGLFGAVYKLGMGVSRICHRSPVYYVNSVMAKYIKQYLKENPADAVIMPHLYPAETITYMKRHGMKLPLTIAVMTDYTCIPFYNLTVQTFMRCYVIIAVSLFPKRNTCIYRNCKKCSGTFWCSI